MKSIFYNSRKFFRLVLCALPIFVGCAEIPNKGTHYAATITVKEPDRIRFSGKGAGAGVMLSGTMGPMGVAIGVAIDEGNGKDIEATASAAGIEIEKLVKRELEHRLSEANIEYKKIKIEILRYGFVTLKGDEDLVTTQLQMAVTLDDAPPKLIILPDENERVSSLALPSYPLSEIKANSDLIEQAFMQVIQTAMGLSLP